MTDSATRADRHALLGWSFVALQIVLLVALVGLPPGDLWPTPSWLRWFGRGLVALGLVVGALAGLGLGTALTATPVPRSGASLQTGGAYRLVRHPIYAAVLAIVVGLVVGSGSPWRLVVGVATVAFFNAKAAWEEQRLAERYPGYADYAAHTPRFVPFTRR